MALPDQQGFWREGDGSGPLARARYVPKRWERRSSIASTIEQIEAMSDAEVRAAYNAEARAVVGLEWWREEIHWRATDRRNRNIERLTLWDRHPDAGEPRLYCSDGVSLDVTTTDL